jgi:hypothetical protein
MTELPSKLKDHIKTIRYSTLQVTINDVKYTVQSKAIELSEGTTQSQYRVFLGEKIIKNWTDGNIEKYFWNTLDSATN